MRLKNSDSAGKNNNSLTGPAGKVSTRIVPHKGGTPGWIAFPSPVRFLSVIFPLLFLIALFFVTHIPRLGTDEINPDAINWHSRSEQYIDAIKSRDFNRTYQHYHPGVTLMFLTGVPVEILKRLSNPTVGYNRYSYEVFHFVSKYLINVCLLVLIVLLIFYLSKVFSFRVSYLTGIFLTIEPFFLGNSRLLHMDALLSLLLINALVCFYLWYKEKSCKWILLAGIFLGLSFWTKNISILAILYCMGMSVLLFIFRKLDKKQVFTSFITIILCFFAVGYAILPALWVNPQRVFTKIYNGSRTVVTYGHQETFLGTESLNPGPYFYFVVLGYKLSPIVLITFVASLVFIVWSVKKNYKNLFNSENSVHYYLLLFALGYFLALELSNKKIDRYLLPLYPIILIFVSYYLVKLFDVIKNIFIKIGLVCIFVTVSIVPVVGYFPYYFIYNSPIFGGPAMAEKVIGQKSFGVGVFEVRDFILKNYGYVRVGFVDRKPISVIYPNSMVFDVRAYGPSKYDILVLDSDEKLPNKAKDIFVYDKTIKIQGLNFWNFYVKTPKSQ